jgi:shikimate dehydrogenase
MTQKPIVAGVMGWPISHSRSPLLHTTWLQRYRIRGTYAPFAVAPEHLEQALRALPVLGIAGVNLTVPLKELAVPLMDHLDSAARRTGSVNMVTIQPDGSLEGRSTDGYGFLANLTEAVPDRRVNSGPVLVIGAGGAARAIVDSLLQNGETRIRLLNRTRDRAERLAELSREHVEIWPWVLRHIAVAATSLVVNTTTQGMVGQPALDLDLALLPRDAVVTDIVYTPLETPLLAAARQAGNIVVDGLGMLLHQARPAFHRWFGVDPEIDDALRTTVLQGDPT